VDGDGYPVGACDFSLRSRRGINGMGGIRRRRLREDRAWSAPRIQMVPTLGRRSAIALPSRERRIDMGERTENVEIEDRSAILELLARVAWAADERLVADFIAEFTDDAVVERTSRDGAT